MSLARIFLIGTVLIAGGLGIAFWAKQGKKIALPAKAQELVEIPLAAAPAKPTPAPAAISPVLSPMPSAPQVDRIAQLFALDSSKLAIVETVSYTSRVPWMKGRPAWIADYATHYETSRHFIARSLNRKKDYFTQKVSPGDRFNVFRKDKNIQFHLVIDLSQSRLWLYCNDLDAGERVLLKTYPVGLGRVDGGRTSGYLTPIGKYSLGEKVAIYKPGTMGIFQEKKSEMIRVFGTRWIPFDKEVEGCSEAAKGYGLHGLPWIPEGGNGPLVEDKSKLGKYESDGCVRLAAEDIEEIFAVVLTKPATVELVKHFQEARLFGVEKNLEEGKL